MHRLIKCVCCDELLDQVRVCSPAPSCGVKASDEHVWDLDSVPQELDNASCGHRLEQVQLLRVVDNENHSSTQRRACDTRYRATIAVRLACIHV
jgi:hypothetical protein